MCLERLSLETIGEHLVERPVVLHQGWVFGGTNFAEGVLTRLSASAYQEQLVLKGGLEPLIASSFASSTAVLLNVRIH